MGLLTTLTPFWRAIKTSPATTPGVLMAWGIPTVCVPLFRFLDDTQRPLHDRMMLSLRDLASYTVGWAILLTVTPSVRYALEHITSRMKRPWSNAKVGLVSTAVGCVLAAAYSGFGAKRFAQWMTRKWFQPQSTIHAPTPVFALNTQVTAATPFGKVCSQPTTIPYRPLLFQRY